MTARPSLLAPDQYPAPAILLGSRVLGVEDVTRPWASGVRTSLVTLEDGRRVVHQEGAPTVAGRAGIDRRIRFAGALRSTAPGLPVPEVLGGDARANPPFAVTSYVAGESGDALLATPAGAALVGRLAGGSAMALAAIPPAAIGRSLSRTWADPSRLATAAARWFREAVPLLDAAEAEVVLAMLGRIPVLLAGPPVVAHGDLAPVNLVVQGQRLAGIVDLERLRLAPAAFDAAWFRLLVLHHHPERWPDAGPPLLAALGLPDDEVTAAVLDDLAVLACLEMVAALPRRSPRRLAWATRARERMAASG
jgi:aminoglycoside phosphotransferase (APT) family kinase protein